MKVSDDAVGADAALKVPKIFAGEAVVFVELKEGVEDGGNLSPRNRTQVHGLSVVGNERFALETGGFIAEEFELIAV